MKLEQFIQNLEILPEKIQHHCRNALVDILNQMVNYAKRNHPYKDRSGNLSRSIKGEINNSNNEMLSASFKAEAEYAEAVEYGTHKGSAPLPFMRPTIELFKPRLEEALRDAVQQALEEVLK
jgi:HK97 gp10 family phage protein